MFALHLFAAMLMDIGQSIGQFSFETTICLQIMQKTD